jgi:Winged helix domain
MRRTAKETVTFILERDGQSRAFELTGRDAWALSRLIAAGAKGVTPITEPGPRWSGYVFNLRRMGLNIETRHESHAGPFPGTHARYVLHDKVQLLTPDVGGMNAEAA